MKTFHAIAIATLIACGRASAADEALGACLEGYAYPYPVHYFAVHAQDQSLQMAYMDVQPTTPNGRTVMLLHGKNFMGAYWGQTAARLSEAGYRVVIPDQIGFGKSSKPAAFHYTFHTLAKHTKELLDHLGVSRTAVLGHSMGGMVATRFALMYPQSTEALILTNPIGLEDWKVKVPYKTVDEWYAEELKKDQESIIAYQKESYYGGDWNDEYARWADFLYRWTLSPDYPRVAWNAALTYDMIFTQPVVYEFPNVTAPTLLIIGQRDRTALGKASVPDAVAATMGDYPELGRATARAIPGARLVELEGVGHLPHIEAFDRFIEPVLDFLNGQ